MVSIEDVVPTEPDIPRVLLTKRRGALVLFAPMNLGVIFSLSGIGHDLYLMSVSIFRGLRSIRSTHAQRIGTPTHVSESFDTFAAAP